VNAIILAQHTRPVTPQQADDAGLFLPLEGILIGGGALLIAAFKWLISREFNRLESTLTDYDRRLDSVQRQQAKMSNALSKLQEHERRLGKIETLFQDIAGMASGVRELQEVCHETEKDLVNLRTEMARSAVFEDKYVRDMTVITSRLDALWQRINGGDFRILRSQLIGEGDR
jgi:hypothetical protein